MDRIGVETGRGVERHVAVVNADAISVQPRLTNGIVRFRPGGKKQGGVSSCQRKFGLDWTSVSRSTIDGELSGVWIVWSCGSQSDADSTSGVPREKEV